MITLKQNDTGIGIKAYLSDDKGITKLHNKRVSFFMGNHKINAQVLDAEKGEVLVVFNKVHLKDVKLYYTEFKILHEDGRIESYPSDKSLLVNVIKGNEL